MGYDLWNECNTSGGGIGSFQARSSAYIPAEHRGAGVARFYCYCPATQRKFREWLRAKYQGDLRALGRAWHRYSFSDWEQVEAPRSMGGYPEWLDWLEFRIDNAHKLLAWRREVIRGRDRKHKIAAHSIAYTLESHAEAATDEWRAAREVEVFGFTWIASRKGNEPWKQFHAVDLVRAGARGKPFWHAEAQAGPLWMQGEVTGRPREDGRIAEPADIRYWNLVSCAGGATGILYPRWRPLLDGPLFGAFGPFGMDGRPTPRSEMCARIAKWANANPELWKSRPVRGDVGIVFVPESQLFNFVQNGNTSYYAESARGAYMAFFDAGLQPDWVRLDHIEEYPMVYLPFPLMLKEASARRLRSYVEQGGMLVSEGCPAYFGDRGKVGTRQPNFGLDELFGAREADVEFMPDLTTNLRVRFGETRVRARLHRQVYQPAGGTAVGWYEDGTVAAVDHRLGKGRTRLVGTFLGAAYFRNPEDAARDWFAGLAGPPRTRSSNRRLIARLHQGEGGTYLWVLNPTREPQSGVVSLAEPYGSGRLVWGEAAPKVEGRAVEVRVGERDAVILRLL
jgi:beta-galactosidase